MAFSRYLLLFACVLLVGNALPAQDALPQNAAVQTDEVQHRIERPSIESLLEELEDEEPPVIRATMRERIIARAVTVGLAKWHYIHPRFTPDVNERWYRAYFAALDPSKIYFLQSDLDEFSKFSDRLCKDQNGGSVDVFFPYIVYQRLLERMLENIKFSIAELDRTQDFTIKETMPIYRTTEDIPWCKSREELQERWRLRMKNVLLVDLLKNEEKAQKKIDASAKEKPANAVEFKREDVRTRTKRQLISGYKMRRDVGINQILETYLTACCSLFDPHSSYMAPMRQEEFNMRMSLSLQGIGATLSIRDSYVTIIELMPGSPAKRSGRLHPGDRIVAVAQSAHEEPVDVIDMSLDKVVQKIRGPKGSEVYLTIMPVGSESEQVVRIVRDEIKMKDAEAQSTMLEVPLHDGKKANILQIYLPSFYQDFSQRANGNKYKSATLDVQRLMKEARAAGQVDGVILDLRGNGGGSLDEAISLTGLFVEPGAVVQVRDNADKVQTLRNQRGVNPYNGPLVVMVDRYSASASEIVAAALQDRQRAIIVGDATTHGKGTVQNVMSLDEEQTVKQSRGFVGKESAGTLKMTIAKFYRINGSTTQEKGVVPDIVFPSFAEYMDTSESTYPNVLPWDKITSANYKYFKNGRVLKYLPAMRECAQKYMAENADFVAYRNAVEEFRKQREINQIPLDLEGRRQYRNAENELLKKSQHYQPVRKSDVDEEDRYHDEDEPEWLEDASKHEDVILDATLALMSQFFIE